MPLTLLTAAVSVVAFFLVLILRRLYHLETTPLVVEGRRVVFMDIGGHIGQTTRQVIRSNLFDQVYTFEPVPKLANQIKNIAERMKNHRARVEVVEAALGMGDGSATLYMPGTHSGTIYENRWKRDTNSIEVRTLDAGRWFRENLHDDDLIFVKINCEGGEVAIIDSLDAAGELTKMRSVMIDFDVKRLFGRDDERERLIGILRKHGVSFIDPRYIEKWGFGTGYLSVLRIITYLRIVRESLTALHKKTV